MHRSIRTILSFATTAILLTTALSASAAMKLPGKLNGPSQLYLLDDSETYDCTDPIHDPGMDLSNMPPEMVEALNNYYPCEGPTWDWGDVFGEIGDELVDILEYTGMPAYCVAMGTATGFICGVEFSVCMEDFFENYDDPNPEWYNEPDGHWDTDEFIDAMITCGEMMSHEQTSVVCVDSAYEFADTCL